jgi:hypothetical protein
MRTTSRTTHPAKRIRRELRIDPYVVQGTWTRDELLQARGMPVTHAAPAKRHHPKAA